MTSLAFPALYAPRPVIQNLLDRHRVLATYGLVMIEVGLLALMFQVIDPRTLESGVNVWVKPAKFFVSIGVYAVTAAWFMGYVRPERRTSWLMRGTAAVLIAAGSFELAYISWQAAQGLESHFNFSTPHSIMMYQMMGRAAVLLIGVTLPLAWEIARRPAEGLQRSFVAAVATGLVLTFLLGGGLGGYMSSQPGHSVGEIGGHTPVFGWNRLGGDLRVAHFFGMHAEQAIPLLGALIAGFAARTRWLLLGAGTAIYVAVTLAVFAQAIAGRPLLPA